MQVDLLKYQRSTGDVASSKWSRTNGRNQELKYSVENQLFRVLSYKMTHSLVPFSVNLKQMQFANSGVVLHRSLLQKSRSRLEIRSANTTMEDKRGSQ